MFDQHSLLFKEIRARGAIRLADVLRLRRDYFPHGVGSEAEAQALFVINATCPVQDTSWTGLVPLSVWLFRCHRAFLPTARSSSSRTANRSRSGEVSGRSTLRGTLPRG